MTGQEKNKHKINKHNNNNRTMTTKNLFALAVSALFVFASCNQDEPAPAVNDGRVQFASGISGVQTRVAGAEGNLWENGDAIGIYMVEHQQPLSASSIKEGAGNVKYTTASTSETATFTSTTPIYYPVNGPLVDFRAYHPYSSAAIKDDGNYWYEMDVQDQSNQSAIDFMTASADNSGAGYDKTNTSAVNLNFQHQLAKVIMNVSAGDGVSNLTGLDVKVKGMDHLVIFDLTDFSLVGTGFVGTPVITPYSAGSNSYELILPPTEFYNLSDCKVEFTVGGNTYVWTISENSGNITDFNSGEKYTFEVTLTKNKVQVSGEITPWSPVNGGIGTAK
ncbi:MAG TPA: hypothetical protein DDZ96_05880 [Porphyromonadaceae bacterium]|jgi:hypothetical protein|nr:hypothetical protein [Porphyromonadaceae bacterium]HBX21566.1 hypothetical protein [Porphyromonadaceae bacterium]